MDFNYQSKNGAIKKINLCIGMKWSDLKVQNNALNTIFSMIDDGDKIISEKEFNIVENILNITNRLIHKKPKDNLLENAELNELINKIKDKSIDIQKMKNGELEKINVEEYSKESLQKRYPSDKYTVTTNCGNIEVRNKSTGKIVLQVAKEPKNIYITFNPQSNNPQMYHYDKNGNLNSYEKDGKTVNPLAEKINQDICAKYKKIFPTTGSNIEQHIKQITKDNVLDILNYYKKNFDESLEDAINNEWGLNFGEKNKNLKKRLLAHIEKCLDEYYGVSQTFSNKISQVETKELNYKGESYSVSRKEGFLIIKNKRTGKVSKINENKMFEKLTLEQKSRMRRLFQELPGEVLADLAVECKTINDGSDIKKNHAGAYYDPASDDITIEVNEDENIINALMFVHELGHAIDNLGKKIFNGYASKNSAEFKKVFEEEKAKYKASGHALYEETKDNALSNVGNYATCNEIEMFAECYALITIGRCSSEAMLLEYFPKTIRMAKKMLNQIRNMSDEDRSRA